MEKILWLWQKVIVMLKRATGIAYRRYPPLSVVVEEHELEKLKEVKSRAQAIRRQAKEFENDVYRSITERHGIGGD